MELYTARLIEQMKRANSKSGEQDEVLRCFFVMIIMLFA